MFSYVCSLIERMLIELSTGLGPFVPPVIALCALVKLPFDNYTHCTHQIARKGIQIYTSVNTL